MSPVDPLGMHRSRAQQSDRWGRLVDRLKANGHVRSERVEEALRSVDRALFVPAGVRPRASDDEPLPIGQGQTISAPHMVAILVEALRLRGDERVLEIGTGSGYNAAVVARCVPEGRVVSVEIVPELAAGAIRSLEAAQVDNVTVLAMDAGAGYPDGAPYDAIFYTCAVPELPEAVKQQLTDGGRLVVPLGPREAHLVRYTRRGDAFEREDLGLCAFVPLTGSHG